MADNRSYSVFASALITVAMNWSHRLIGVASMVILARLLTPKDFGLIAMASLTIGLADVLINLGVHIPLIQRQDASKKHYDAAWTIRLGQTALSTTALFLLAPVAASYFQDDRVEIVLRVLSFSLLLGGLENIGVVDFQKRMQFGADFRFRITRRLLGFLVTLIAAFVLRSYWALVIGMLVEKAAGVALSYWFHPMRPRISLAKVNEIFAVSQWVLFYNIGRYLRLRLPSLLVGRWESAGTLGAWTLADDIAVLPSTELLSPINRALFPAYARSSMNAERLKELFLLAHGVQTLITMPAAIGLALVAEELVPIMLGEKWRPAIPFLQILAIINVAQALSTSGVNVLLATGRERLNALYGWAHVGLFTALAFSPWVPHTAMGLAWLALFVSGMGLSVQFWLILRILPDLNLNEILAASYRPLLAVSAMLLVVVSFPDAAIQSILLTFLAKVFLGALCYITALFALWAVSGRPEGPESYMLQKGQSFIRTIRS